MERVSVAQVRAAAQALRGVARYTPMESSRPLQEAVGGPVHLKCENLQRTGSFKIRGAYLRISRLSDQEKAAGVVAASAGNHAQGVALAASLVGTSATVFMPIGASIAKLTATRAYGAQVQLVGQTLDESLEAALEFAARTGAVLVHPFDHLDVLLGQGTVGLEIAEQVPDLATVVVATGGGGLISGVAAVLKELKPGVRIVGVQAEQAAAWPDSLAAGRPVRLREMSTLADGIAVGEPSALTFAHVSDLVDDIVTVSEDQLSRAMLLCLERAKLVVEAAGVAAVAAVMTKPGAFTPPVVAVLSGGNIDPLLLQRVVAHGLAASGRYMTLRIPLPDRPGQLARVSDLLAQAGANVTEVLHTRHGQGLQISEVILQLSVETRGEEHRAHVIAMLEEAGFEPTVVAD